MQVKNMPLKSFVFNVLIILFISYFYLKLDGFFAIERFYAIGINTEGRLGVAEYIRRFVYILEYSLAIFILWIVTRLNRLTSIICMVALWALVILELNFNLITGKPLGLADIANLNVAAGEIDEAIKEFFPIIKQSLSITVSLFLPLFALCLIKKPTMRFRYVLTPFLMLGSIYLIIAVKRGEPALIGFPKGYSYAFGSVSLKINDIILKYQNKPSIEAVAFPIEKMKKVIFIIDESVNYPEFAAFPLKTPYAVSYGLAFSGANCSAASNYILRKGVFYRTKDNISQTVEISPVESLFKLAKKAQYKTAFIDTQNILNDIGIKNYVDDSEIASLDFKIKETGENFERDTNTLSSVATLLKEPQIFILINKIGAHFPFETTLKPELRTNIREENYKRSVKINAVDYLERLSEIIDNETIVFYTSDHGQNITGRTTHCNTGSEVTKTEYTVPIVLMTKNASLLAQLREKQPLFNNRITHIEFSESTRNSMGLKVDGIGSVFKPVSLLRESFCGLYGPPQSLFGFKPNCFPLEFSR